MIPTIAQRVKLVGEERAYRETEQWIDGLLAENKRLKFQQDQLRLTIGSGEPLHVDHETLLELAQLFKEDLKELREENTRLKLELDNARKTQITVSTYSVPHIAATATPATQEDYVFVIYGEEYTVRAFPHESAMVVFGVALHKANVESNLPWQLFSAEGFRVGQYASMSAAGGPTRRLIASLPIGHGG